MSSFAYTRRADGLLATVSETVKQPDGSFVDTLNSYTYDANNRLTQEVVSTSAAGGDYATDYTLDLVGNRVKKVTTKEGGLIERIEATLDARDRVTEERVYNTASGGTPVDTVTYQYDRSGAQTLRQTTSGSKLEQIWDLRNRLAGAITYQLQSGLWVVQTTADYKYTADGIRSRVTENGTATQYTIDPMSPNGYAQVIEERTSAGALLASSVHGASPISTFRSGSGAGLYLADGHSGVRQVLSAAATVLAAYRYDAFGNKVASAGTFVDPVGYRGERFDSTLGQYYMRARFYDPRDGAVHQDGPAPGQPGLPADAQPLRLRPRRPAQLRGPERPDRERDLGSGERRCEDGLCCLLHGRNRSQAPAPPRLADLGDPDAVAWGFYTSFPFVPGRSIGGRWAGSSLRSSRRRKK